jgi:endonuclease/exonuclease/phosphatase family metal-dependent hydrolase
MQFKVICLNLWQGGNLMDGILGFLKDQDADILLLQEVYDATTSDLPRNYHSIEILTKELSYEYFDFAPAMLDKVPEGKVESGNAVFSKFPITFNEAQFFAEPYRERDAFDSKEFPTTPRNLQHVSIDVHGDVVNVFNFQGVWDLDGDNYSPQRQRMSEAIIAAIQGKTHVILAGDTNAKPTNKAMVAIESHLNSVFGNDLKTSFNMRRKDNPGYATACVDLMYVSSDMHIMKRSCPDVDISDHLPLVVELAVS